MKKAFYLLLSVKTPSGFVTYGEYQLVGSAQQAYDFFASLQGDPNAPTDTLLHIDLMEMADDIPYKVKTIGCTLDELVCNCKAITVEIFRLSNLKEVNQQ